MSAPTAPLVPRLSWDAHFVAGHRAHAVLARAAASFSDAREWPAPASWRAALDTRGLASRLATDRGIPITFVVSPPKTKSRRRRAPVDLATIYDERIYARGEVPSRADSWHDFLNMLVWATFPASKRALNMRQRVALRERVADGALRIPGARTREQDTLSMLDEGGAIVLVASGADALATSAIESADTDALCALVEMRQVAVLAFGHALHEHILSSDTTVKALAVPLFVEVIPACIDQQIALADVTLSALLADRLALTRPSGNPALPVTSALFEWE